MHINGWVHASDLMKRIKSANSISTFSSEEGLPDNHVITIRERELTVDFPELIQNNIKTDTVTLDLDAEWDGIHPVIIFGPNASGTIAVEYTGEPVHIPGAVMQYVGGLDCSVMGLDDSGEVRLVTKAAPNTFEVVESGEYIGQISEDDVSLLGQILSAIEDVETATSDASNAAEAATAAANSANTAAAKATNAANSANTAATKATAAANSANSASERAENAYDVLTPIIAEIGVNGNQPRATTNPNYIATASDAYAAKPLEICIKGETRQNLWVNPASKTVSGVMLTANADGSFTISGQATAFFEFYSGNIYSLKPNTEYSFTSSGDPGGYGFCVCFYSESGENISNLSTQTFTSPASFAYARFRYSGTTSEDYQVTPGTYRVMLNEGSEAQPWCPPGLNSVGELSLVTAGKNLLVTKSTQPKDVGISVVKHDDGSITFDGIVTEIFWFYDPALDFYLPNGTYTLSGFDEWPDSQRNSVRIERLRGPQSGNIDRFIDLNNPTKTVEGTGFHYFRFVISAQVGDEFDNVTVYPQLELGSTATAYEPPAVTTTPIDLDGNTLCSLPDGTHDELTIDATGAVTLTKRTWSEVFDGTEGWSFESGRYGLPGALTYESDVGIDDAIQRLIADKLPVVPVVTGHTGIRAHSGTPRWVDANIVTIVEDSIGFKEWLGDNNTTLIYPLAEPQTIPLPAVTLPTLPSPNITVYHDSDVPSDITVEYVQDINIVLDNLNAKIAALNVAQSSSS